jgi:hypothetical protein
MDSFLRLLAEVVEHAPPADRRDRAQLGGIEGDPAAERSRVADDGLARPTRVAGVERRMRVILDVQLGSTPLSVTTGPGAAPTKRISASGSSRRTS